MLGDGDVNGSDVGRKSANTARRSAGASPACSPTLASFAGIRLSLEGDAELCTRWRQAAGDAKLEGGPGAPLRCRLRALPPSPRRAAHGSGTAPRADGLGWTWSDPCGQVWAPHGEASVRRDGDGDGYAADVRVAAETRATRLLLVGLASLVLQLQGGLILHAASVVLDADVFAFMGPSGAGKSTACQQVGGAVPFSVDRLALLPPRAPGERWLAHAMPGGSPAAYESGAQARWLPLRGLLRVQASSHDSRLERCSPALAVLLARESTFQLGLGAAAEHALLGALERLARDAGVGRAHVRLGADLTPLLRQWQPSPPRQDNP